ncbi:MAG: hypothetical protein M3Q50_14010 [Chloroflexota bacterium]|nr:hypothetical protein [Chloroflexia bacterium]MDQ3227731.1 hypothetical protein [Chloroflexota bacterium]
MTSPDGLTSISFTDRINRLNAGLVRDGISVSDMRRSPALELQFAGAGDLGRTHGGGHPPGIEPIEGPIAARLVPVIAARDSRLRYFLDGAQRTFAVWRCGLVPTAATVVAAGILQRVPGEDGAMVPGTLRMEHCWLIPDVPGDHRVVELVRRIKAEGMRIQDPRDAASAGEAGAGDAGVAPTSDSDIDYGRLHELAYVAALKVREEVEAQVLADWVQRPGWDSGSDWIVVDGRLRSPAPRVIGLVKQFSDALLSGPDAETLLGLAPGYRTTAFHPTDRFRGGQNPEARTLWYIRLWDSAGMDARHALVRIEASHDVCTTEEIDAISSWILAERTPRATGDSRWATLLYPVHLLERILKRRLDADTRGWPSA